MSNTIYKLGTCSYGNSNMAWTQHKAPPGKGFFCSSFQMPSLCDVLLPYCSLLFPQEKSKQTKKAEASHIKMKTHMGIAEVGLKHHVSLKLKLKSVWRVILIQIFYKILQDSVQNIMWGKLYSNKCKAIPLNEWIWITGFLMFHD